MSRKRCSLSMDYAVFVSLFAVLVHPVSSLVQPRYNVCQATEGGVAVPCAPSIHNVSCSFQLLDYMDNQCYGLKPNGTVYQEGNLVNVSIAPYVITTKSLRPYLNVSISNIKFTEIILKLSIDTTTDPCIKCMKFLVSNGTNLSLFWDCKWKYSKYPEHQMTLEYRAKSENYVDYRRFHFLTPRAKSDVEITDSKNLELLIYRENSREDPNCLTFYWARPPDKFDVLKYRVTLNEHGSSSRDQGFETPNTTCKFCGNLKFGTRYNISVEPWIMIDKSHDWGRLSYSDSFDIGQPPITKFIVPLVCCIVIITVLLLSLYIKTIKDKLKPTARNCVLVHVPTSQGHVVVVKKLVLFLKSLNMQVRFSKDEIVEGSLGDWWTKLLGAADLIIFVSNPPPENEAAMLRVTIFPTVAAVIESRVKQIIDNNIPKRYVNIRMPYCTQKDFFGCVEKGRTYHIYQDRFELLHYLLKPPTIYVPACFFRLLFSSIFRSKEWDDLKSAIDSFFESSDTVVEIDRSPSSSAPPSPSVSLSESDEEDKLIQKETLERILHGDTDSEDDSSVDETTHHYNTAMIKKGLATIDERMFLHHKISHT